MFNRTKASREPGQALGRSAVPAAAEVDAAVDPTSVDPTSAEPTSETTPTPEVEETPAVPDLDELMQRLEQATTIASAPGPGRLERVADEASEHARALQSTLQAQKQAQRMLALASKVRGQASAQAEQIMREAQETALRLHREAEDEVAQARERTSTWATTQRRQVEEAVASLLDAAAKDADRIRAEAERTALVEAAEGGRQYVAQVSAAAERAAEEIRAEARGVLARAHQASQEAAESARDFADTIASYLVLVQRQGRRLAELTDEAATRVAVAPAAVEPAPDRVGTETRGADTVAEADLTATFDAAAELEALETALEAELDTALDTEPDSRLPDDPEAPHAAGLDAEPTADGDADGSARGTSGQAQAGTDGGAPAAWPLGSLFRQISTDER